MLLDTEQQALAKAITPRIKAQHQAGKRAAALFAAHGRIRLEHVGASVLRLPH